MRNICKQDYLYPNLEDAIKKSGLKLYKIAEKLGIHVVSLNNKRIGYILWRDDEKELMKELLEYKGSTAELFYSEYNTSTRKYKNRKLPEDV